MTLTLVSNSHFLFHMWPYAKPTAPVFACQCLVEIRTFLLHFSVTFVSWKENEWKLHTTGRCCVLEGHCSVITRFVYSQLSEQMQLKWNDYVAQLLDACKFNAIYRSCELLRYFRCLILPLALRHCERHGCEVM